MKKFLLSVLVLLLVTVTVSAQKISYQAVVRDSHNRLVVNTNVNVAVTITYGSSTYTETLDGTTNANGLMSLEIGGASGFSSIDWRNAWIKTVITLPGGETVEDQVQVTAIPLALYANYAADISPTAPAITAIYAHLDDTLSHYPTSDVLKDTAAAIRADMSAAQVNSDWEATSGVEEILNKPDLSVYATNAHLNDTLGHYLKTVDLCTSIESNCTNVALRNTDNNFTGTNTVPNGFSIDTTNSTNCGNLVVNACDLFAVFDSLNRRITALEEALDALMRATPPTVTVALSDISSNSMKATATANSNGSSITSYEFCISVNSDMSTPTCFTSTTANYTFTGLDAYTTYYVTASATNLAGTGTSSVVSARTPAHAPAGILSSSLPPKPTGFQVTVSSLDFKEPAEGTVQIFYKQGSDCSADEEGFTAWPVSGTLATGDDYTQNLTGLEPLTNYCVMVKVNNVDSTTTYGPVNTTSGEDIRLIITPESTTPGLCEGASVEDNFTAAPNFGDASEYSYEWSDGTNTFTTNPVTITFNSTGVKTITCVATHQTEGYTLTGTVDVTVTSLGVAPTFTFCENMLVVDVNKSSLSNVATLDWGDGSEIENIPSEIDEWTPNIWHAYSAPGGTYNIIATSTSGCTATQTVSLGRAILAPCVGLREHEGGVYAGMGHNGADDGREYADENGIYAVTDYDGNIYPVVKIGSQCWMAENLRTEHSPSTGSLILLGADQTYGIPDPYNYISYTSKMAAWVSNDANSASTGVTINNNLVLNGYYSEIVPRLGLLYNWCAAVDTFKSGNDEVSSSRQVSTGWSPVLNLVNGNRRGVCPKGWHLPSAAEWETMLTAAGVEKGTGTNANQGSGAGKLATGCYWKESNYGERPGNYNYADRNSIGFSAIPAGNFNNTQHDYRTMTEWAYFWTSTQDSDTNSIRYGINYGYNGPRQRKDAKNLGASVRCVRD